VGVGVGVRVDDDAGRDGLAEVDAVGLEQVEDARVAQPVVALGGVRELVEHDDLVVGVLGEVLDYVVPDEAAAARDDTLGPLDRESARHRLRLDARGELAHRAHDPLALGLAQPPAHRQADDLLCQRVELGQQAAEARDAAVHVVALVHGGDGDALRGHVLHEGGAPPVAQPERVQPVGGRGARLGRRHEHDPPAALEVGIVVGGVGAARADDARHVAQVGQPDGRVDVVHVELEAELGDVRLHAQVTCSGWGLGLVGAGLGGG
jgi:hypothetical protein